MKRVLGVCYYPEHWEEDRWAIDAAQMVEAGLKWVRIGEFAWSRLEPGPGDLHLDWLARAIDVLGEAGLQVIIGTPTATPPRWMLDKHPDMLAVEAEGNARGFGSRRHYCFSHEGYKNECRRITRNTSVKIPMSKHGKLIMNMAAMRQRSAIQRRQPALFRTGVRKPIKARMR